MKISTELTKRSLKNGFSGFPENLDPGYGKYFTKNFPQPKTELRQKISLICPFVTEEIGFIIAYIDRLAK